MTSASAWFARLFYRVRDRPDVDNPLLEFTSEVDQPNLRSKVRRPRRRRWQAIVIMATVCGTAGIGIARWPWATLAGVVGETSDTRSSVATKPAGLLVTTTPPGAHVIVDGESRGVTPVTLAIRPGMHSVSVRSASHVRDLTVYATPGSEIVRDIEFPGTAAAPALASMTVTAEPQGARIAVNGQPIGVAPITIGDLAPGRYHVVASDANGTAERVIDLASGENNSVAFVLAGAAAVGWLQVSAPFDVQLIENGEIVGTNASTRVMLLAGRHELLIVNRALEFSEARHIDLRRGQTMQVSVEAPHVAININARPWAEVSVDGKPLGETPIANVDVAVGTRRLVFRHPALGERQETVVITTKPGQRIAVDLTK